MYDSSAVPSYNFSSRDTWKHCKLETSCSVYALDSSRTTPLVEEVLRQNMIHFFSNSNAEVVSLMNGATSEEKRASAYDHIRHSPTWLGGSDGYSKHFVQPRGRSSMVSENL
jgi:hypothetical protein